VAEYLTEAELAERERVAVGRPWAQLGRIKAALEILTGMDVASLSREERDLLSFTRSAGDELRDCLEGRLAGER